MSFRFCFAAALAALTAVAHGQEIVLTQSVDNTSLPGHFVAAAGCFDASGYNLETSYLRSYRPQDHGIAVDVDVTSVNFAIDSSNTTQPLEIRIYRDVAPLPSTISPFSALVLLGSERFEIPPIWNVIYRQQLCTPVTFMVNSTDRLVVEIFVPNGVAEQRFFGIKFNTLGEIYPSFVAAAACGVPDPDTYASVGFPTTDLILDLGVQLSPGPGLPPIAGCPPHSGTAEDFELLTGLNGATPNGGFDPTTGTYHDVKAVVPGDTVTIVARSSGGSFDAMPFILVGDLFTTGSPPAPPFPGIVAGGDADTFLIYGDPVPPFGTPPLVPPGGAQFRFPVMLPTGVSLMIQSLVGSAAAQNGIFASTDGHELQG